MRRRVYVVLPGDIDDPADPSGGNVYDRRVCQGLRAAGWSVDEIPAHGTWPEPDRRARTELASALAGLPDDSIVIVDGLVGCAAPDALVPQANRLRLVVVVHLPLGREAGLPPARATELDARERQALQAAALVVVTSPWTARLLVDHHQIASERIQLVLPGTDPAPVAPGTDGRSRLLCVGAVTRTKGQDILVEALATLTDASWTCEFVGPLHRDPRQMADVRRLIDGHGLRDRIRLIGPLGGERLAAAYATADVVVLPSRMETYGIVVIEALARAIPVLAADVGGVSEALGQAPDGRAPGLLVAPDDPAALAGALRGWLDDPELRHRLRVAARQRRGILSRWQATSQRMADLLERLTGEPG